jgi:Zn-dependent protease with chaperone function
MDSYRRVVIILGLILSGWVFVSPWVDATLSTSPASSWNFHIAGALALLLWFIALVRSDELAEYGLIAVAVWLVISPWVLNLPEAVSKQAIFYGIILGPLGWIGRSSFKGSGSPTP